MIISLSFDDGRNDNFNFAYPILQKYSLTATFHIVTGFIDGSYLTNDFGKEKKPMSVPQLQIMAKNGMEIASHGDKHVMDTDDFKISFNKITSWGLGKTKIGFSVPNSLYSEKSLNKFVNENKDSLLYIRVGRSKKDFLFRNKVNYFLYETLKIKMCYDIFNRPNLMYRPNKYRLFSLVVKEKTAENDLQEFISVNENKNCWLILMLHSISENPENAWEWKLEEFKNLASFLEIQKKNGSLIVLPINQALGKIEKY